MDRLCIDKTSSAELTETINSMFQWYRDSDICYAYLEDVESDGSHLKNARWFIRGWTLQELVAPRSVIFYSKEWKLLGTKSKLASSLETITGIDESVLLDASCIGITSIAR
jgi:hypothetical protein